MKIFRLRSLDEYKAHVEKNRSNYVFMREYERRLADRKEKEFTVPGISYPAGKFVDFAVDYLYSDGRSINWRERLICPVTGLNNRLRSSVHILDLELGPYPESILYITEQVTPLFSFLKKRFPDILGSEYLGPDLLPGTTHNGIRHEDMTGLSFPGGSIDHYLSFECFEHIPFYKKAIPEIYRTLRPEGIFLGSFPFDINAHDNLIKASIDEAGNIVYFTEPEYHGDPVNEKGILCYTVFGWELLDEFRQAGFKDVYIILLWSDVFGYLGGEQAPCSLQKNKSIHLQPCIARPAPYSFIIITVSMKTGSGSFPKRSISLLSSSIISWKKAGHSLEDDHRVKNKFQQLVSGLFCKRSSSADRRTSVVRISGVNWFCLDTFLRDPEPGAYCIFLHDKKSPYAIQNPEWKDKLFRIIEPSFAKESIDPF